MTISEKMKNLKINFKKDEFKSTVTNLNNIFIGSMIVAVIGLGIWLWKVFGIWLIVGPLIYVTLCYLGKFIKENFFSHIKELSN